MPAGEYPGVWLLQLVQQAGVGDYHHKTQAGPFHQDRARCLGRHPAGTGASPRPCGRGGVVVDREAVRTRPCVSRVWWPHSPAERTRRHRPRRGPGLAPRPGQAGPPPPTGLGMKRMGDITYIRARGGICLSGNRPRAAAPRKVVGYAMVDSMRYRSWYARRSIWRPAGARRGERRRSSTPGRGSQYTSEQLARHLKGYGTRPSVGRTGVRWAGAWAESFNATLKERKSPRRWSTTTRRKAINDIASRVEPGTQVRHVSTQRSGTGRPTRPNTILQAVTKPPDQHNQPQSETRPAAHSHTPKKRTATYANNLTPSSGSILASRSSALILLFSTACLAATSVSANSGYTSSIS